eukprot:COSAG01_NODE_47495_length_389_cov_3.296552_1_plen_68_part_10
MLRRSCLPTYAGLILRSRERTASISITDHRMCHLTNSLCAVLSIWWDLVQVVFIAWVATVVPLRLGFD